MQKHIQIALVAIGLLFSACSSTTSTLMPRLTAIDVVTKPLPSRELSYTIEEDNRTVSMRRLEARWIVAKLNRCTYNAKRLEIANKALNAQIKALGR